MGSDSAGDALGPDADTLAEPAGIVWSDSLEGGLQGFAISNSNGDSHPDTNNDRNGDGYAIAYRYTDTDRYMYADTNGDTWCYANADKNEYAGSDSDADARRGHGGDANGDDLHGVAASTVEDDTGRHSVGIDAAAREARSDVLQLGSRSGGGGVGGTGSDGVYQHQAEVV